MVSTKVLLVSKDQELIKFCRDIIDELLGSEYRLFVEDSAALLSGHDLCIWDFVPGEHDSPSGLDRSTIQRCFFIVERNHISTLREVAGTSDLHVLFKPVTPGTLRVVLGETCRVLSGQTNATARIGVLRAERDRMLQCLLQANLKLRESEQERTNLLARTTHDFRAPLMALSGYCSLLLEEQVGPSEQREILDKMQCSAKRLLRMAEVIFQLSTAGRAADQMLNPREEDIRDCIDQALHEVTPFVERKRIAVAAEIGPSTKLSFEKAQLEQMLINLLANACKFTPRSGSIDIKGYPFFWERRTGKLGSFPMLTDRRNVCIETPNCFRIDIRDSGPEIPSGHLARIFEECTSYSGEQDRSGGGLGLAICKMIAHQHQGKVWAENSPAGPVFSFVLPYQQKQASVPVEASGLEAFSYVR